LTTDSRDPTKLADKALLALFARSRDEDAFAELIARHGPMVMSVCRQVLVSEQDAEDAFQAVFLVLARKAGSVAWQSSIANWLYGVAWRISRRATRRTAKRIERSCDMEDFADNNEQSSTTVDVAEQLLYPALYKLRAKYREPIILCHLQGKTRSEAAEALLKVNATGLRSVQWSPSKALRRGTFVMAMGLDSSPIATGVISSTVHADPVSIEDEHVVTGSYPEVFDHDMTLKTNEFGGPVLDLNGHAIGITIADPGLHGCLSLPSEHILECIHRLK